MTSFGPAWGEGDNRWGSLLMAETHVVFGTVGTLACTLHIGVWGSGAWQLSPWGNGKQPYPTVALATPHHQNKNTTGSIAMESSILLSWDWHGLEFHGLC